MKNRSATTATARGGNEGVDFKFYAMIVHVIQHACQAKIISNYICDSF